MTDEKAIEAAEDAAQRAIRKAAYEIAYREGEADGRWFSQALAIVATKAAIAAYLAQREADGFVMVPVEPSGVMIDRGFHASESLPDETATAFVARTYRAMIAARPKGDG